MKEKSTQETQKTSKIEKKKNGYERADLSCSCLVLVLLVPEKKALVREAKFRPAHRAPGQLLEAAVFEVVADNSVARRIGTGELAKPGDGEKNVLKRVKGRIFGRHTHELVCGREETCCSREAQVRLALRRRSERRRVTPGGGTPFNRSIRGVRWTCGKRARA